MTIRTLTRFTLVACVMLIPLALMRSDTRMIARQPMPPTPAAAPVPRILIAASSSQRGATPVFGHRVTPDGGQQLYFLQPELQFQKTSYRNGRSTIVLRADHDVVEIALARETGFTIRRGARSISLYPPDASEADFDRARAVLAGSTAVRRFRTLVAELDDSKHAGVIGLQLSDAIVGVLDGDVGAPARLGKRLRARTSAGLTRVKDGVSSCWYTYEQNVTQAETDREQCLDAFSIWNPARAGCWFEWTIRAEGDWFEYLACSSLGALLRD